MNINHPWPKGSRYRPTGANCAPRWARTAACAKTLPTMGSYRKTFRTMGDCQNTMPITNQSFCGENPPQRLGWAEPRWSTWGFRLWLGVRGRNGGRAFAGWRGRRVGTPDGFGRAERSSEDRREGREWRLVVGIGAGRRAAARSTEGPRRFSSWKACLMVAGLSWRRSLLKGDATKQLEISLLTKRTRTGL